MSPYISIIIPLYNSELFLREALDSISEQTFSDFEVICINDKSTDATLDILKDYSKSDSRFIILNNEYRMGAAASRNKGLYRAKGKYVLFLDGDDLFDEKLLSSAMKAADLYNAEITYFEVMHVPSADIHKKRQKTRSREYLSKFCNKQFSIEDCNPIETLFFSASTWSKMIKRDFLIDNGIDFQTIESSNDISFSFLALFLAKHITVLKERDVMVYARDHITESRISNYRDPFCAYYALLKMKEYLLNSNSLHIYKEYYYAVAGIVLINAIRKCNREEEKRLVTSFICRNGIKELIYPERDLRVEDGVGSEMLLEIIKEGVLETYGMLSLILHTKEVTKTVKDFFKRIRTDEKRVTLWGIGKNGQSIIDYLGEIGESVDYLADGGSEKAGTKYKEFQIFRPEEIIDKTDVIILSTEAIEKKEIEKNIKDDRKIVYIWDVMGIKW